MNVQPQNSVELRTFVPRCRGSYQLPMMCGVPFPEGALRSADSVGVLDPDGNPVPCQTRPMVFWPDGSIKWLCLHFRAKTLPKPANEPPTHDTWVPTPGRFHGGPREAQTYRLCFGKGVTRLAPAAPLTITDGPDAFTVNAGRLRFTISRRRFRLFDSLAFDGNELMDPKADGDLVAHDAEGTEYRASLDPDFTVRVEEQGELHCTVRVSGCHRSKSGAAFMSYDLRIHAHYDLPHVVLQHTFINTQEPEGGVRLGDITARLGLNLGARSRHLVRYHTPGYQRQNCLKTFTGRAEMRADAKHVFLTDPALVGDTPGKWHIDVLSLSAPGSVEGWIDTTGERAGATAEFTEMQCNYFKGIVADDGTFEWQLWPAWAGPLKLNQGMAKTHRILLSFHAPHLSDEEIEEASSAARNLGNPVSWFVSSSQMPVVPFEWFRDCKVNDMHRVFPPQPQKYPRMDGFLDGLFNKWSRNWEHIVSTWPVGMLDYGDAIDDHYRQTYSMLGFGLGPEVWNNNEYDFIHAAVTQYCRTGHLVRLHQAQIAAQHLIDVDTVHYSTIPGRTGGIPHHCTGHTEGTMVTSHMHIEGLIEYYLLTGRPDILEAAITVGDYMVAFEQHTAWIYWADPRECGWPLVQYCKLYEVTGEKRFKEAADRVMAHYYELNATPEGHKQLMDWWSLVGLFLMKYVALTGDERAKSLFLEIGDAVLDKGSDDTALGAVAYAYELTRDRRYAESAFRALLQEIDASGLTRLPRLHKEIATRYRRWVLLFKMLDEVGVLKALEYPTIDEAIRKGAEGLPIGF